MDQTNRIRRPTTSTTALVLVLAATLFQQQHNIYTTDAYITSRPGTVPVHRQMQYLRQLTEEVCHQPAGELSPQQSSQVPELLQAWSAVQPVTQNTNKFIGISEAIKTNLVLAADDLIIGTAATATASSPSSEATTGSIAYALSAAKQAERLVKRLIDEHKIKADSGPTAQQEEEQQLVSLSTDEYNHLLALWARVSYAASAATPSKRSEEQLVIALAHGAAERCEELLLGMSQDPATQPNMRSFKSCIVAWKNVASMLPASSAQQERYGPAIRAHRLLAYMVDRSRATIATVVRDDEDDVGVAGLDLPFLPDQDCFDMVLQAWSRSPDKRAPTITEDLMRDMELLYQATGQEQVKPRTSTFNAVLTAWTKSIKTKPMPSSQKPHQKNNKSSGGVSKTTIEAAEAVDAVHRACDLLSFMELLAYEQGDEGVQPDRASYNVVVTALARYISILGGGAGRNSQRQQHVVAAAKKAEGFLSRVEASCANNNQQGGIAALNENRAEVTPDTMLYNTVMSCLAKTELPNAHRRTRSILDRQISLYETFGARDCRPDVYSFTTVIGSCVSAAGTGRERQNERRTRRAFETAVQTLEQSHQYNGANHVTYGNMLKCCSRLLTSPHQDAVYLDGKTKSEWIGDIFQSCCERGHVSDYVLTRVREAASSGGTMPGLFKMLMNGHSKTNLPKSWTRNVDAAARRTTSSKRSTSNNKNRKRQHRRQYTRRQAEV